MIPIVLPSVRDHTWLDDFAASPFGMFLATPSEVVPAGIAVAALILGVVNLIRSHLTAARPRLRAHASVGLEVFTHSFPEGDEDYRDLWVVIRNRGDAVAHDVRAVIRQKNGNRIERELAAIPPDTTLRQSLGVSPENPANGTLIVKYTRGPRRGVRVKFDYEEP